MKKKNEEQGVITHLNLLQGGPLHNKLLTNPELVDRAAILVREDGEELNEHLPKYRWSPETVTGESGKVARVWKLRENVDG